MGQTHKLEDLSPKNVLRLYEYIFIYTHVFDRDII